MNSKEKRRAREAKKAFKALRRIVNSELDSGPGFDADKELRYYLREFNNRLIFALAGEIDFPSSYNVMRYFFDRVDNNLRLTLKKENDHLLSLFDFLEYATSEDASELEGGDSVPFLPNQIYSFNSLDDADSFVLSTGGGAEFTLGSISCVYSGGLLYVLLVGGMSTDVEQLLKSIEDIDRQELVDPASEKTKQITVLKEAIGLEKSGPVRFRDHDEYLKVNALACIDTKTQEFKSRYICKDMGDRFINSIEDEIVTRGWSESVVEQQLDEVNSHSVLFEFMKYAWLFPEYYNFKINVVVEEQYKQFVTSKSESKSTPVKVSPERDSSILKGGYKIRRVSAIRKISANESRGLRRFTAPKYTVSVGGFWRKLKEGSVGSDPQGRPAKGRTWIKSHDRWKSLPDKPTPILLKSKISEARKIAASEKVVTGIRYDSTGSSGLTENKPSKADSGSLEKVSREAAYEERKKLTLKLRYAVLQRDDFRCKLCGADPASGDDVKLEVDHIRPVIFGGKTAADNLRTLCKNCNSGKSDSIE